MKDKIILGITGHTNPIWFVDLSDFSEDLDAAFYFYKSGEQTRTGKFSWTNDGNGGFKIGTYEITYNSNTKTFSFTDNNSEITTGVFQAIVRIGSKLYCIGPNNKREALDKIWYAGYDLWED